MKISIDTVKKKLIQEINGEICSIDLYSKEVFELLSDLWLKVGWNQKYIYTFSWMGRPIIQLPEDMVRMQEVIYGVKPDVIIETGVAHGGSLIYYASLCKLMGKGRIIGIDIEIRPHNRQAIESHEFFSFITLIEGSSIDQETAKQTKGLIKSGESVLVILDSCHTKEHVLNELEIYSSLVTSGSYLIAADGIMKNLYDVPRGNPGWAIDNPVSAIFEFISKHPEFSQEEPKWAFNESQLNKNITHWPFAFLKKK